jgi:hypothetical protein
VHELAAAGDAHARELALAKAAAGDRSSETAQLGLMEACRGTLWQPINLEISVIPLRVFLPIHRWRTRRRCGWRARCTSRGPTSWADSSGRRLRSWRCCARSRCGQGSAVSPLCIRAQPRHTIFTNIFGGSVSEATTRPNPRCGTRSSRAGRRCSAWRWKPMGSRRRSSRPRSAQPSPTSARATLRSSFRPG